MTLEAPQKEIAPELIGWNQQDGRELLTGEAMKLAVAEKLKPGGSQDVSPESDAEVPVKGQQKKAADAILAMDPEKLTPTMRSVQGLVENFKTADDKSAALQQFKGAFESTVKASDTHFKDAASNYESTMAKIGPDLEQKMAKVEKTMDDLAKAAEKIPEADRERINLVGDLWQSSGNSPQLKAALEKEMNQYPGLLPAFKAADEADRDAEPLVKQVKAIQAEGVSALNERVMSRAVFADIKEAGGDAAGAKQMRLEALAIQMSDGQPELEAQLLQKLKEKAAPKEAN